MHQGSARKPFEGTRLSCDILQHSPATIKKDETEKNVLDPDLTVKVAAKTDEMQQL